MLENISVEKAKEIIQGQECTSANEKTTILEALGKVLAEDVISNANIPPFDRSPLDGYALRSQDITSASKYSATRLKVVDTVSAGMDYGGEVSEGEAVKIMTGAKIPRGANVVIRFEETEFDEEHVFISTFHEAGSNIVRKGEDICVGDVVMKKGMKVEPAHVGVLSALGINRVQVYKEPVVGIISTGDELVGIEEPLEEGKIRNSNSYMVAAQVMKIGAKPLMLGICRDNAQDIEESIRQGLEKSDILITTGGVSVGDYDLVKDALVRMGAQILFWRVKIKPGTPVLVAKHGRKLIFGLSGNPAAAYVNFENLVKPFILKSRGIANTDCVEVDSILESSFSKKSGQNRFVRAFTYYKEGMYYTKLPDKHSSGVISSLVGTNSLILVKAGMGPYSKGQKIKATLLERLEV